MADLEMKLTRVKMAALKKQMGAMSEYTLTMEQQVATTRLQETMVELDVKVGESVQAVTETQMIEQTYQKIQSNRLYLMPRLVIYVALAMLMKTVESTAMAGGLVGMSMADLYLTNMKAKTEKPAPFAARDCRDVGRSEW
jgi:hypothetical protein